MINLLANFRRIVLTFDYDSIKRSFIEFLIADVLALVELLIEKVTSSNLDTISYY